MQDHLAFFMIIKSSSGLQEKQVRESDLVNEALKDKVKIWFF